MRPKPSTRTALCELLAVGSLGCFRIGVTVGPEISQRAVERIVPGETAKDDVLR